MAQQAQKSENEAEAERGKLDRQLKAQLEKKGLIVERSGEPYVNITPIHPYYLPKKFQAQYLENRKEKGEALIPYADFFEHYYSDYRKGSGMRTPTKFLDLAYGKASFKEGELFMGVGGSQPIYLNKGSFGTPKVTADIGVREMEMGQTRASIEAGVAADVDGKAAPYMEAKAGGFFATFVEGIKKILVGFGEGIASVTATIAKGVEYAFSLTLGPWIGKLNLGTGGISGTFSWIMAGYQEFMKLVGRLFGDRFDEKPYVKEMYVGALEIKKGARIEGEFEGKKIAMEVKEFKDGVITDGKGDDYKVEREFGGEITLYPKLSFWSNLAYAFNPVNLAKDAVDIAIVGPYKKAVDTVDTFKTQMAGRIPEKEFGKYEKGMADAEARENFNTARYIAKSLAASSSGVKKAEYMLELDRIEWKLANSGLFLGYLSGAGMGNKRTMVKKEIETRMRKCMGIIRNSKGASMDDYNMAQMYLQAKLDDLSEGGLGRKAPREQPFPENMADELWEIMAKRGDKTMVGGGNTVDVNNADFMAVAPNEDFSAGKKRDWARLMGLLQRAFDDTAYKEDAGKIYYNLLKSGKDTAHFKNGLLEMAKGKLAKAGEELPADPSAESKEKVTALYEAAFIRNE